MAHPATLAPGSSPAVAEVNGVATIVQSSLYRSGGHGGGPLPGDVTKVYVLSTGTGLCRADWPQFRRDARRTGAWRGAHDAWIPFTCPAAFVRQQYLDFLDRTPDASGTAYWTSRMHAGTQGSAVIRSFLGSNEFANAVAPVVRAHLAMRGTHPATTAEVTDAVAALRNGTPLSAVAQEIAERPEVDQFDDPTFVATLYRHALKRAASPSELAAGTEALGNGTTRGELAVVITEATTAVARLAPEVNVAMIYLAMLDRAPDPGGWAYWVPKAASSSTDALVTGFQRSNEYRNRVL
jgi:hypothetical protein